MSSRGVTSEQIAVVVQQVLAQTNAPAGRVSQLDAPRVVAETPSRAPIGGPAPTAER